MAAEDVPQMSAEQRQNEGQLAPRRRENPYPTHEVYFVQAQTLGLIKIGYAVCSQSRLRTLQTGSPDRLKLLAVIATREPEEVERALHVRFRHLRQHGEWFRGESELMAHIEVARTDGIADMKAAIRRALNAGAALSLPRLSSLPDGG